LALSLGQTKPWLSIEHFPAATTLFRRRERHCSPRRAAPPRLYFWLIQDHGAQYDPEQFIEQAALFQHGVVKLLPRMAGEISSVVLRVTDSGKVLVTWIDDAMQHYYVYKDGKVTPLTIAGASIGFLVCRSSGH
jgi:hypothetical protein